MPDNIVNIDFHRHFQIRPGDRVLDLGCGNGRHTTEAARYAGIGVARTYVTTMAIAGAFAGLAGAIDVLGWEFQLGVTDIQTSQIGFMAIAVAVLGRNRALGVFFSALLFGALLTGTSTRNLDATVFRPDLAGNLTLIIQGLVVLFVGADVLILWLWNRRRRLRVAT